MNKDPKKIQARRKKKIEQNLKLGMPVLLVALLLMVFTVAGVNMSLDQSRKGSSGNKENTTQEAKSEAQSEAQSELQSAEKPADEEGQEVQSGENVPEPVSGGETDGAQEQGTEAQTESTTAPQETLPAADLDTFNEFLSDISATLQNNSEYLTMSNSHLPDVISELKTFDEEPLSASQRKTYEALTDALNVEIEGTGYEDVRSSLEGQNVPLCSVEGGVDYYNYLLKKYSGTNMTWDEMHPIISQEIGVNFGTMDGLSSGDPFLALSASEYTKKSPDTAYAFDTVTASSDAAKKALASVGLINGWSEFGLIRAYQMDSTLPDDSMRSYLIASTRLAYAIYGIVDISVNAGGWTQDQVKELCTQYYKDVAGDDLAASLYQKAISSPGKYAAAAIGYLELVKVEAAINQQEGYTEAVLLDVLFNQGPASFRVYDKWLGIQTN